MSTVYKCYDLFLQEISPEKGNSNTDNNKLEYEPISFRAENTKRSN